MFNIAEAHRPRVPPLGDYKHKQRNRLKFLVRSLGWDALQGGVRQGARGVQAGGGRAAAVRSASIRRSSRRRRAARTRAGGGRHHRRGHERKGHGSRDRSPRRARPTGRCREDFDYWTRTNVRRQKQPGFAMVTVTTVLGDLTSAQLRHARPAGAGVRRRHRAHHLRSERRAALGARGSRCRRSTAASPRRACRAPAPRRSPT